MFESERCQRCGTLPDEWIDPATGMPHQRLPYEVASVRCNGCVLLEEAGEDAKGQKGIYLSLTPNLEADEE